MTDTLKVYPPRPRADAPGAARDLSAELNPQQAAAASHGDGPLLIIAGAGTGKTRTLVYRVAHLIDAECDPKIRCGVTRRPPGDVSRARTRGSMQRVDGGPPRDGAQAQASLGKADGLPKDFTIRIREIVRSDAAVRAQLGYAAKVKRFPKKERCSTCIRHLNPGISIET